MGFRIPNSIKLVIREWRDSTYHYGHRTASIYINGWHAHHTEIVVQADIDTVVLRWLQSNGFLRPEHEGPLHVLCDAKGIVYEKETAIVARKGDL